MKRKYIIFFMQFFTSLCIVSVGFASWTFVSGDSITATGNIYAEDVITNSEIVYIENAESLSLRYYKTGFLNDKNQVVDTATISITYVLVLSKYKELYPKELYPYTSLSVITHLYCISEQYNILNDTNGYITPSYSINDQSKISNIVGENITQTSDYQINFDLENILQENETEYSFTINYTFNIVDLENIDKYDNFYKNIYPSMAEMKFSPSIILIGE